MRDNVKHGENGGQENATERFLGHSEVVWRWAPISKGTVWPLRCSGSVLPLTRSGPLWDIPPCREGFRPPVVWALGPRGDGLTT